MTHPLVLSSVLWCNIPFRAQTHQNQTLPIHFHFVGNFFWPVCSLCLSIDFKCSSEGLHQISEFLPYVFYSTLRITFRSTSMIRFWNTGIFQTRLVTTHSDPLSLRFQRCLAQRSVPCLPTPLFDQCSDKSRFVGCLCGILECQQSKDFTNRSETRDILENACIERFCQKQ